VRGGRGEKNLRTDRLANPTRNTGTNLEKKGKGEKQEWPDRNGVGHLKKLTRGFAQKLSKRKEDGERSSSWGSVLRYRVGSKNYVRRDPGAHSRQVSKMISGVHNDERSRQS